MPSSFGYRQFGNGHGVTPEVGMRLLRPIPVQEDAVKRFIARHADRIIGVLSGFDRLVFRGTLRSIAFVAGLLGFMRRRSILLKNFGAWVEGLTERVEEASLRAARAFDRPIEYLASSRTDKDAVAREIAKRDGVTEGLVAVLTCVEPCQSFEIYRNADVKRLELVSRARKCKFIYHYAIDPVVGWMSARIQTWLPFSIQICINGREWLAREMDRVGLQYRREDNCFPWIQDVAKAQQLMDQRLKTRWPQWLNSIARRLNPDQGKIFPESQLDYYWSVYQSEWATDFMFRDFRSLSEIYPPLVRYGITAFSSGDVMRFLGRKVNGHFRGEIVSDFKDRPEGVRIKHFVGKNSVKAYDKPCILRIETTIHDAGGIKVFRPMEGDGHGKRSWQPMRQGIADLHRRAQVSQASNERYADALAAADTTTTVGALVADLDRPLRRKHRKFRGLRAWSADDLRLFRSVNRGEFKLNGFRNRDLQLHLYDQPTEDPRERRRRGARTTRLIRLLRAHGLVRKLPRSHRYKLTPVGQDVLTAILGLQDVTLAKLNRVAS